MSKHRSHGQASHADLKAWRVSLAQMSDSDRAEASRLASEPASPVCCGWHRCLNPAAEAARREFGSAAEKPGGFLACPCHSGRWIPAAVREHAADIAAYHDYRGVSVRPPVGPVPERSDGSGIALKAVLRMYRSRPQSEPRESPEAPGKRAYLQEQRFASDVMSDEELSAAISGWWP